MTETKSPVDTLRRAASLMRERAEAATPGQWRALAATAMFNPSVATRPGSVDDLGSPEWVAEASPNRDGGRGDDDAEHIASWHPAVALAVADWLEEEADSWASEGGDGIPYFRAYMVARAYLGSES